jgi:hypothetical protein
MTLISRKISMKRLLAMKYKLLLSFGFCAAGVVVGSTGCASIGNVDRSELRPAWQTALAHPADSAVAFTGVYQNYGTSTLSSESQSAPTSLAVCTSLYDGVAPLNSTVELAVKGLDKIALILRDGTRVIEQKEFFFSWDTGNKTMGLENSVKPIATHGGDVMPTGGLGWKRLRLTKGSDGALYLQTWKRGAAAVLFVIPVGVTGESWGRWEPVANASKP